VPNRFPTPKARTWKKQLTEEPYRGMVPKRHAAGGEVGVGHDAEESRETSDALVPVSQPKPRLLDQVRSTMQSHHYSRRTQEA